ncbi:MAG TPA: hypothetical protein VGE93_20925 [Bryobacteraceae bacterium]
MKLAPSVLYTPVMLACVAIVFTSVYSYSWSSTLVNLNCSIQDDSFYYFVPAWNASHGAGFTFGGEKTSGFEPLYELLLTVLSYFILSLESLVRSAINLNGWLFASTALLCGFALRPLIRSCAPQLRDEATALSMLVGGLSYLCLHAAFFNSLTGKENALAAMLLVSLIWTTFADRHDRYHSMLVGALCGLLLVTRIAPASFLYVGIAIALVHGWKGKIIATAMCLLPVTAWGLFAHIYFGHVLPMSMLVKMTTPNHLTVIQSIKSGLRYGWESWKFSVSAASRFNVLQLPFRGGLRTHAQISAMVAALAVALLGALKSLLGRSPTRAVLALMAFDSAGVLSNVLFGAAQAGRSDDMYYTVWYLYDLPVLVAINCGFAIGWLQASLAALRSEAKIAAVLLIGCVVYFFGDVAWYARLRPYDASDDAKFAASWPVKKHEAADWFLKHVKPANSGYKVIAFSAGTVDYYLFDHVVNLDGLANNAAGEALIASGSPFEYAKKIRPDYFIENCDAEKEFSNLRRLYSVPFSERLSYCVDEFIYDSERSGGR